MSIFSKWFSSKKQQDEAVPDEPIIEQAVSTSQEAVVNYCEEGQKQLAAGNYIMSLEYFQAAIEANKHDERAYIGLSEAYLAQGKTSNAEKTIYQLLAINPESHKAQEQLIKIKGRKTEQETATDAQHPTKYTEEELREKVKAAIKVTKGGPTVTNVPFDPRYELTDYRFPTFDLLNQDDNKSEIDQKDLEDAKTKIVETLGNYGIALNKIKAIIGYSLVYYEIGLEEATKTTKIKDLEDVIARGLDSYGVHVIVANSSICTGFTIEVPHEFAKTVSCRSLMCTAGFQNTDFALPCLLGVNDYNNPVMIDLAKMPHVLIAGATGTGKSTLCHSMILSLLMQKHPAEMKFVLFDTKGLEFNFYTRIERHYLAKLPDIDDAVVNSPENAKRTLASLCIELAQRTDLLKSAMCRNVEEYNEVFKARKLLPTEGHRYLPYIVVVIDDFALLSSQGGKEITTSLENILGAGKLVGIHVIVGTSRMTADVITAQMKSCLPARFVFRVNSANESKALLDVAGANLLNEYGEMLVRLPGTPIEKVHGMYATSDEINGITNFIGYQRGYSEPFLLPEVPDDDGYSYDFDDDGERDSLFEEAARIVVQTQQGSSTMIQRKLKLGYNRAGRIIDQLEAAGIVGPFSGSKSREVKVTSEAALEQILRDIYNKENGI